MIKADKALKDMLGWSGTDEPDIYPYVRDVFTDVFGYPKDHIRVSTKEKQGKIPDLQAASTDVKPRDEIYWLVGEVKKERGVFRSADYRRQVWKDQLSNYVTPDTVYALLIDPITLTILRPDGSEVKTVDLDSHIVEELLSATTSCSLSALHYDNSTCDVSLLSFKEGQSPSRFLDVGKDEDRKKFYSALRLSARDLIDFSLAKLGQLQQQYLQYVDETEKLKETVGTVKDESVEVARRALKQQYNESVRLFEDILKAFEAQIGRQMPKKEEEARRFLQNLYATEGSSLVLARILFVRFLEDHDMAMRKISNGGIKAFRDYHRHIKDDYQFLLTDAYREAEQLYRRLFEPSVFDWSHEGDGQLSRLLRIFYRLNAFDFAKISGDILGNLYERFLDIDKRKKLGEYYTPMYVAEYVLERIGFYESPALLLDPACGSGTFLIAAADGLIERLLQRGVKLDVAIKQTVDLVHGLDINVFAAFIAQLQLIWHLLPYLKRANMKGLPELKIYGGTNSLVYLNQKTLFASVLELPPEASVKVRDSKFRYVVGNPPYIRNERLKDTGPWRKNYELVDFRNSDVAYFFLSRAIEGRKEAMPSWLEDGGRMCFVLPMSLCDSHAASAVREVLLQYRILEITDLEDVAIHIFPSPQASGRATVAPVLVFVEKTTKKDGPVDLVQIAESAAVRQRIDKSSITVGQIRQTAFQRSPINPYGQILPKLRPNDIPVLETLMNHPTLREFAAEGTPTYGITVAKEGGLRSRPARLLLPLAKGLNVSTFRINPRVSSWVDLAGVRSKSIWQIDLARLPERAYAMSIISLAPQTAVFNPAEIAFNDSAIIMIPKPEYSDFPWDTLINSSPVRFLHLLVLRTALVGVGTPIGNNRRAAWCHTYPRTISALPIPKTVLDYKGKLTEMQNGLHRLAKTIATRWDTVTEKLANCSKKPLAFHNVDFVDWQSNIEGQVDLRLVKEQDAWTLRPYVEDQPTFLHLQGNYELLNVLKYLFEKREEEGLTAQELQNFVVPEDPDAISRLIDVARDPDSPDIREFKKVFREVDEIVAKAYGLDEAQWTYVQNRLAAPPFDVLEPRWPWKSVEMREIQEYKVDRFA